MVFMPPQKFITLKGMNTTFKNESKHINLI